MSCMTGGKLPPAGGRRDRGGLGAAAIEGAAAPQTREAWPVFRVFDGFRCKLSLTFITLLY